MKKTKTKEFRDFFIGDWVVFSPRENNNILFGVITAKDNQSFIHITRFAVKCFYRDNTITFAINKNCIKELIE